MTTSAQAEQIIIYPSLWFVNFFLAYWHGLRFYCFTYHDEQVCNFSLSLKVIELSVQFRNTNRGSVYAGERFILMLGYLWQFEPDSVSQACASLVFRPSGMSASSGRLEGCQPGGQIFQDVSIQWMAPVSQRVQTFSDFCS